MEMLLHGWSKGGTTSSPNSTISTAAVPSITKVMNP
jgi:hypothetical protein